MKKRVLKTILAVAGAIGTTMLSGCKDEPVQALYGTPADIMVKSSNEYYAKYLDKSMTKEEVEGRIDRSDFDNMYAGKTEKTMTDDITYPTIQYNGPAKEELEDEASYKLEILGYNESGFVSSVKITKE